MSALPTRSAARPPGGLWRPITAAALFAAAACAFAAERNVLLDAAEPIEDAPGMRAQDTWDLRLGALAGIGPDFEGSEDYEPAAVPYLHISWRDRIVLHVNSLRGRVLQAGPWDLGVRFRLRAGRDQDENGALRGLGDVDRTVEAGAYARYRRGPWRVRLYAMQDIGGEHEGAVVEFSGGVQIPFQRPWFVIKAGATWASDDFMQSYFGVDAGQARRARLRPFAAEAGIKEVRLSIASRVPLGARWSVVGALGYKRLLVDAADSPLVVERGDDDQFAANLGLVYRF